MNYLTGFCKNRFDAYLGCLFVKAGVILSALAIAMFFLDVAKVLAFTGKSQATIQCDGNSSQCDIEDESEEDGQDAPTLVSFSKNDILSPAFNYFAENFRVIANSNQSPPDFPPETI